MRFGDMLFILESEKGTEEVECLDSGILRISAEGPKLGGTSRSGAVIGYPTTSADETLPAASAIPPSATPSTWRVEAIGSAPSRSSKSGQSVSPRARRVARELGIDPDKIRSTGRGSRVRERDVRQLVRGLIPLTPIRASPLG